MDLSDDEVPIRDSTLNRASKSVYLSLAARPPTFLLKQMPQWRKGREHQRLLAVRILTNTWKKDVV